MARKRTTSSYKEKLLYDNTLFYGINSINSINNEGYFKHLVNFDTDSSYQSLTPRKGWIITSLYNTNYLNLNIDNTCYFKDVKTGQYVFIDFSNIRKVNDEVKGGYKTTNALTLNSNKIYVGQLLTIKCDEPTNEASINLLDHFGVNDDVVVSILNTCTFDNHECLYIKNLYLIDTYLIKAKCIINEGTNNQKECSVYLQFVLNDTDVIITIPNLEELRSYDSNNRNIASNKNIANTYIMSNMSSSYNSLGPILVSKSEPTVTNGVAEFPTDAKFLMNTVSDSILDYFIYPTFFLTTAPEGKLWVYTYSIYSTSADVTDKTLVYESPLFKVSDDNIINPYLTTLMRSDYESFDSYDTDIHNTGENPATIDTTIYSDTDNAYTNIYGKIYKELPAPIVYMFRKPTNNITIGTSNDSSLGDNDITTGDSYTNLLNAIFGKSVAISSDGVSLDSILDVKSFKNYLMNDTSYRYILVTKTGNQWNVDNIDIDMSSISTSYYGTFLISNEPILTGPELKHKLDLLNPPSLFVKNYVRSMSISFTRYAIKKLYNASSSNDIKLQPLFNNLFNGVILDLDENDANVVDNKYIFLSCYNMDNIADSINAHFTYTQGYVSLLPKLFNPDGINSHNNKILLANSSDAYYYNPYYWYDKEFKPEINDVDSSIFSTTDSYIKKGSLSDITSKIHSIDNINSFFTNGLILAVQYMQINSTPTSKADFDRTVAVTRSRLIQSINITRIGLESDVTYMNISVDNEPDDIIDCDGYTVFNSEQGYRLVVWKKNKVYLSEAGDYGWFKSNQVYSYENEVIKVVPFKNMLIVFTASTVYSIFPYEEQQTVETGEVDSEGNKKTVQQTVIYYNSLPVLYNINCDKKYANVIKVYNKMILFYSALGHLYFITPTTTIDSDTEWTLKLLNPAADDILLNYKDYMNERLKLYDKDPITLDTEQYIKITSETTIDYIKIRYSYNNYMYELRFDTTKSRFTVYDTIVCNEDLGYLEPESFITKGFNNQLAIFKPASIEYDYDTNADINTIDFYSWNKYDILTEINTGIINLNNQWKKRFRALRVTYKNLNAHDLKYDLDVLLDDVYINTCMSDTVELKNIYGAYAAVTTNNGVNILENNSVLFNFMDYHSNKLITHSTNIPSIGKFINLILRFKSKGKYKIQLFEITYKEHSL